MKQATAVTCFSVLDYLDVYSFYFQHVAERLCGFTSIRTDPNTVVGAPAMPPFFMKTFLYGEVVQKPYLNGGSK